MEFTLANVAHGTKVYMKGDRDCYIKEELDIDPDYEWDDEHWHYIDHYTVCMTGDKLFMLCECIGGEQSILEFGLTPEQVMEQVALVCGERVIEYIK